MKIESLQNVDSIVCYQYFLLLLQINRKDD